MTDARLDPPPGVMGYVDRPSAEPGETLELRVSCDDGDRWSADLVRILAPGLEPPGPELREEVVEAFEPVERPALVQPTRPGSYVHVPGDERLPDGSGALSVAVIACPTLPGARAQALVSRGAGWTLGLDETGAATFTAGGGSVSTGVPVLPWCWYVVAGSWDPDAGVLRVVQDPVGTLAANRHRRTGAALERATAEAAAAAGTTAGAGTPLLLAGASLEPGALVDAYDGRLERPVVAAAALEADELARLPFERERPEVVAAWDFAATIGRDGVRNRPVHDAGPHGLHGEARQHPARGVTGHDWDGSELDFRHAPAQYGAIHFHSDDLTDCGWEPQLDVRLPDDLPSGVYAVRVRAAGSEDTASEDHVPFVVRPRGGEPTAPVLLVLSTNSYLAYANQAYDLESPRIQNISRKVPQVDTGRRYQAAHRADLGASLYDPHPDMTGVCYSSWRRPILTMRPAVRLANAPAWQFNADLQIVDWLTRTGRAFDVLCDRDVHDGGADLLARWPVVLTGTHPEYPSGEMLDSYDGYVVGGGRLVYMGGNGFYWVTAFDPDDQHVIEIRRHGGTEAWRALPGEGNLSFTGEPGGVWRGRARAPQKLTGVGFVAQGYDAAAGYRRNPDLDPRAAWVLDGVEREYFGDFGTMGGAAGLELDAVDPALGTPPQTIVIASSEGHPDEMLEARENYGMTLAAAGGARNPRVRADLTLLELGAGAVFSTGSIAFAGSLAHDGYENEISRLLGNVVDRFASGRPVLDP